MQTISKTAYIQEINRQLVSTDTPSLAKSAVQAYYANFRDIFKAFVRKFKMAQSEKEEVALVRWMCDLNYLYAIQIKLGEKLPPDLAEIAYDFDNPDYPGLPHIRKKIDANDYLILN